MMCRLRLGDLDGRTRVSREQVFLLSGSTCTRKSAEFFVKIILHLSCQTVFSV